jgi:flavoprotein
MGIFSKLADTSKKMYKMYDKVKMNKKLTYDELFEIMKEGTYPLGEPEINGSGIMRAIRFQTTGKYQVMVAITSTTITISKSYSGVGGLAKELVGDAVTDGWYSGLNKENLDGNEAVEAVGKEIARLLQVKGLLAE